MVCLAAGSVDGVKTILFILALFSRMMEILGLSALNLSVSTKVLSGTLFSNFSKSLSCAPFKFNLSLAFGRVIWVICACMFLSAFKLLVILAGVSRSVTLSLLFNFNAAMACATLYIFGAAR